MASNGAIPDWKPRAKHHEYVAGGRTFYVRVPWQLYLLAALVARHGSMWQFGSSRSQSFLDKLLSKIEGDGLRYEPSGRYLSSRTNGIAYDVLS